MCLLALGAGCGGDDGPVTGDVEGVWIYEIQDATGSGASCDVTAVDLEFTRSGSGYEGMYTAGGNGNIQCTFAGGGTQNLTFGPTVGTLVALSASDTEVRFTFATTDGNWMSTGVFQEDGNVMGGKVTMFLSSGGTLVELNGTWRAERD